MIKMIMFDMGDTINIWNTEIYAKYVSEKSHSDVVLAKKFIDTLADKVDVGRMTMTQHDRDVSRKFHVPIAMIKYAVFYRRHVKINPEMVNVARRLKRKYILSLLTNAGRYEHEYNTTTIDMKVFDYVFVSAHIGLIKPYLQIYRYVLKKTGLKPNEILFIDNNAKNVAGARKVGIKCIHFVGKKALVKELKRLKIW